MIGRHRVTSGLSLLFFALSSSGCVLSADKEPLYTSGTIEENSVTATAEVIAIDHSTRSVALRMVDGSEVAFEAGSQVERLDQGEAGDSVRVSNLESVVYHPRKPGESAPGVSVQEDAIRAEPDEAPGAARRSRGGREVRGEGRQDARESARDTRRGD